MTFSLPHAGFFQKTLRSPAAWSLAGALSLQGSALLTFMLLARLLTPAQLGAWATWLALAAIADMTRQGFIQNGLVRFTAAEPGSWSRWLSAAFVLNLGAALAAGGLLAGAALLAGRLLAMPELSALAAWALPFALLQSFARLGEAAQVALREFQGIFWANSLSGGFQLALTGWFFLKNAPLALPQLLGIAAAGAGTGLVFTCFFLKKQLRFEPPEKQKVLQLLRFGRHVAGTNFFSLLFQRLDLLLVGAFLTPAAAGVYNVAARLAGLLDLPLNSLSQAQFPVLAKASAQGREPLRAAAWKCVRQLVLAQAPLALLLVVLAPQAVGLVAGKGYGEAAVLLQVLALASLVKPWGRTLGMALDAAGKPALNFRMLLLSAAISLALLLALLPWLGALGAALAAGLGVVVSTGVAQWWLRLVVFGSVPPNSSLAENTAKLEFGGTEPPKVSVVTVNYRQAKVTCELLDSLRRLRYPNLEVIVVDNGSLEDQTALFQKHLPGVQVVVSEKNLGFAGGNNLGVRRAAGDFLFFINNDTEVADGLVENLLWRFGQSPGAGAVSPKIKYFHSPEVIQYAGFTQVNPLTGRNRATGKGETDRGQHDDARPTPYAHGAAMMVRREVVERVGGMPEEFFLYYEELDWCEQIRRAGWEIWYEPSAAILHKESVSTGKASPLKMEYLTRNRIRFMRRNFGGWRFAAFLTFFCLVSLPVQAVRCLLEGKLRLLSAIHLGVVR